MKFRDLSAKEIECRINRITENGLSILLYKTSRTDMAILDEVVGAENWSCEYTDIKGNLYCGISIYVKERNEWVTKWDCGIESRDDGNGNEKKGEASDAFKRAGTKWGIGRELYAVPSLIWINKDVCDIKKNGTKFSCYDKFFVSKVSTESGEILELEISKETRGNSFVVYVLGKKQAKQEIIPVQTIQPTDDISTLKTALIDYINLGVFDHPENVEDAIKTNNIANMKRALEVAKKKEAHNEII
jgi:hypothetical protein